MNTVAKSNARLVINVDGVHRIIPIEDTPFTLGRGSDRDLPAPNGFVAIVADVCCKGVPTALLA